MSTCFNRSALMFCALMMMSHLPPVSAGMITSKTVFSTLSLSPSRLAISVAMSTSDPTGLPWSSNASWGG